MKRTLKDGKATVIKKEVQRCEICDRVLRSPLTQQIGRCQICDQASYRKLRRKLGLD